MRLSFPAGHRATFVEAPVLPLSFCFRFAFVLLSFAFRLPFVCLSFCFRFARAKRKGFSFSAENRLETKSLFVLETKRLFVCAFRLRASIRHRAASCVRTTNRLMPSQFRSDGGRPQREAAACSPHGRPRPVRSPRAAHSPRIGAPTSAPSSAEQPAPLARIFGERREDFEAASAQRRRRRRDEDEDEFEARAPRTNAR